MPLVHPPGEAQVDFSCGNCPIAEHEPYKTVSTVLLRASGPHYPTQAGTLNSVRLSAYVNSGRTDSNRQQSAWKADALPIELRPLVRRTV